MGFLIEMLLNSFLFMVISLILPGFRIRTWGTAVMVSLIYGIGMVFFPMAILAVLVVLAPLLGITIALSPTLAMFAAGAGIFLMMPLQFLFSAFVLTVADHMLEDFVIERGSTALLGAILLSILRAMLTVVIG